MNTTPNTPHPARRPEPRSAVAEIARVLEPGATFCGTTFLSPKVPFGDDGTQQAVDAALRELASAVAGRVGGPRGKAAALAPASCAAQCAHTCELRSSLPLPRGTLYPVCVVLGIYILKGSEFMECFGGTLLMLTLIVLMHAMDVECLAPTLPEVEVYAILSTPEVVTVRRPVVDSPRCHPLHSRSLQRYLLTRCHRPGDARVTCWRAFSPSHAHVGAAALFAGFRQWNTRDLAELCAECGLVDFAADVRGGFVFYSAKKPEAYD